MTHTSGHRVALEEEARGHRRLLLWLALLLAAVENMCIPRPKMIT